MEKINVLAHSDSPIAGTGYGVVSKHVLGTLWNTGRYHVDQLAINAHGDFVDRNEVPWEIQPAKLLDPREPHGLKMFLHALLKKKYDIVWTMNDLYVTKAIGDKLGVIRDEYRNRGWKPPVFIYYYPVDCKVKREATAFLEAVDIPVCYTKHGREETLKVKPELESRLLEIPHGVDSTVFRPLSQEERQHWRKEYFKLDPETTLVINVNRNAERKQLPYCMLAFQEFKKIIPNSKLYLHTAVIDRGGNLQDTILDLGLPNEAVIFPMGYSPATPMSSEVLNRLYNCGDLFLNTSLGEGWGLFASEALATGTPLITGRHTCMPQIVGENEERGYLYPCKDQAWIDASGFRAKGLIPDIVDTMFIAYLERRKYGADHPKLLAGRKWAEENDWKIINRKWIDVFSIAENISNQPARDLGLDIIEL